MRGIWECWRWYQGWLEGCVYRKGYLGCSCRDICTRSGYLGGIGGVRMYWKGYLGGEQEGVPGGLTLEMGGQCCSMSWWQGGWCRPGTQQQSSVTCLPVGLCTSPGLGTWVGRIWHLRGTNQMQMQERDHQEVNLSGFFLSCNVCSSKKHRHCLLFEKSVQTEGGGSK